MKSVQALTLCRSVGRCVAAFLLIASGGVARAGEAGRTDRWESVGWGGGGLFWCAAWHPTDPNVLYMGGDVAGVYKSDDKGLHWRFINRGITNYEVYSMAVSPAEPDTVFALTVDGLHKSIDAGETWRFLAETGRDRLKILARRDQSVRAVAVSAADPKKVFAGSATGALYRSGDGGETWEPCSIGAEASESPGVISSVAISPANPDLVFAASTALGVLRSDDGGATWSRLDGVPTSAASVVVHPRDDRIVYAAFRQNGVMKSTDRGKTWAPCGEGIAEGTIARELAIDPLEPETIHLIGRQGWNGSFHTSRDGGKNWIASTRDVAIRLEDNPTNPKDKGAMSRMTNIALNPQAPGEIFLSGNWRNCFSADGGRTWEERSRGADITCAQDIRFHDGNVYVVAMDEGLLRSRDDGATWEQLFPLQYGVDESGHGWRVHVDTVDGRTRIISTLSTWDSKTQPFAVLVSRDGGTTFERNSKGLPTYVSKKNTLWHQAFPRALAVDPTDPDTIYLGIDGDPEPAQGRSGGGLFRSVDGGRSWKQPAAQPGSRRMFFGLAIDPDDSNRIYWAGTGDNGGLYRSNDAGGSWERVFDGETWPFNAVARPGGVVYCLGNELWRSRDRGETWQRLSSFQDGCVAVGMAIDPKDPDRFWISRVTWGARAQGGIYRTDDGGATWREITGDIPYRKPLVLRYDAESGYLWAGGVGLFRLKQ